MLLIIILYEQNIVTQVIINVPHLEGERCIFEQFALRVSYYCLKGKKKVFIGDFNSSYAAKKSFQKYR